MRRRDWTARLVLAGVWVCAGVGCGSSSSTKGEIPITNIALGEVGGIFYGYRKQHKPPPQGPGDFAPFANGFSNACAALTKGDVVVRWGAGLDDSSEGARTVLAYEKKAPEEGGAVLMQDGTLKAMTADEFKAAPKAGK